MRTKFNVLIIMLSFLLSVQTAYGLDLEYKDYVIKKGDTLWDISQAELGDYYLWPNIWKENPEISNPDLIYPEQMIRIPIYLLQRQVQLPAPEEPELGREGAESEIAREEGMEIPPPEAETGPAVEEETREGYLVDKAVVMLSGYISPTIPAIGKIIGTPTERSIVGKMDYVYIQTQEEEPLGKKYYSFRSTGRVKHPNGTDLGFLIEITGVVEVVGSEAGYTKAVVKESFDDINVGDPLQEFVDVEPPMKTKSPRTPDIHGFIVATRDFRTINAEMDIVYIDKGAADGVDIGDLFFITSGKPPEIEIGQMIVLLTKDTTATAIITYSDKEIVRKDTY